jgi:hypothetical protein
MTLLFLDSDLPTTPALSSLVKPIAYVAAFVVYGRFAEKKRRSASALTPLFAGLLRTVLGYALGAASVLLVTTLPGPVLQAFLALSRFGIWFGIARLFFSRGSGRGAFAFAVLGVALNLALDWTLLGGVVTAPA